MEVQEQEQTTILVVEDEPITRKMITSILQAAGFAVCAVANGRACLDSLARSQPDVILMDVQMPELDGLETCRRIKAHEEYGTIPVVFVTARADNKTLEAAFGVGGRDYIRKPVNRIELLSRLRLMQELQHSQKKRIETEKLKSALETAGGVCHKLNQPLQFILGAIQIVMMETPAEDSLYPQLDAIREKIEDMGKITRKLAEITRYRTKTHAGGQYILDIDDSTRPGPAET